MTLQTSGRAPKEIGIQRGPFVDARNIQPTYSADQKWMVLYSLPYSNWNSNHLNSTRCSNPITKHSECIAKMSTNSRVSLNTIQLYSFKRRKMFFVQFFPIHKSNFDLMTILAIVAIIPSDFQTFVLQTPKVCFFFHPWLIQKKLSNRIY